MRNRYTVLKWSNEDPRRVFGKRKVLLFGMRRGSPALVMGWTTVAGGVKFGADHWFPAKPWEGDYLWTTAPTPGYRPPGFQVSDLGVGESTTGETGRGDVI